MEHELLPHFLVEGRELVARAAEDLAGLKGGEAAPERLESLFRNLHTLKGSTAIFDLPQLTAMLHAAETRLEAARRLGGVDGALGQSLLRALDLTEGWLDLLQGGGEPSARLLDETRKVEASLAAEGTLAGGGEAPAASGVPGWAQKMADAETGAGPFVAVRYTPAPDAYFRGDDPLAFFRNVPDLVRLEADAPPAAAGAIYDPFQCTLTFHGLSLGAPETVRAAFRLVSDQVEIVQVRKAQEIAPAETLLRTVRVDAARLDLVASLLDDLVIAKNALLHESRDEGASSSAASALERAVSSLHAAVADMRLTPLQAVFSRFPRQVREVAAELGKEAAFTVRGERVVLDKSVVEGLYEPLLHLLRNALDHGLEPADVRAEHGKPAQGRLTLSAEARGGEVAIRLEDDGRGVDVARVRALAVQRGLISDAEAAAMDDEAAARLIFAAGFSTASQVSALSGRGVGMDAVRASVERMGGRVELLNRPGRGLAITLALPAHVLLTKALTVRAGGEAFGAALSNIGETHRVHREEVTAIRAGRAYVRRDTVIPLLRLSDLMGAPPQPDAEAFPVLTVETPNGPVGVQVDAIGEQIEAPLRPMRGLLTRFPGMMGTILQGDGDVLLVLDLQALAA